MCFKYLIFLFHCTRRFANFNVSEFICYIFYVQNVLYHLYKIYYYKINNVPITLIHFFLITSKLQFVVTNNENEYLNVFRKVRKKSGSISVILPVSSFCHNFCIKLQVVTKKSHLKLSGSDPIAFISGFFRNCSFFPKFLHPRHFLENS